MTCPQLLFVCWFSSVLAVTYCMTVDGYSCTCDYWHTVTCILNITANPVGQSNTTYHLEFKPSLGHCENCLAINHSYSCVCKSSPQSTFTTDDSYDIDLCHESGCKKLAEGFMPAQNIQLTPPHQADVQQTPETFNITWKSGYEYHRFLRNDLEYSLLLQTPQGSKELYSKERSEWIQKSQLIPGATYCIKVRSKPSHDDYNAIWSKWSPQTCWETEAREEQENIFVILTQSLGPVCVVVGVLLFVFSNPAARMKIKTLSHTPSPAPFFQPLFKQHEGNLQEWLSPQGKFVLTYKTEEILTNAVVTVVPKPITKDPEENQDFHNNPTVTQLAFTQCQNSYVGLPGVHEASPPLTVVCAGNTSYTQLPCPVWGFGIGEVEAVVSSPPDDFLEISCADSGCSCEDLTQISECSLPNSPVDHNPPPSSDYCILNKTAEGIVPVLVSKKNSPNVPSDLPQEDDSVKSE
ncbi:interleukin-21 receptor-like [Thunnus albacares]|uniref:interleukin-21 receptor-like n=1 Tax=Thunnus albacares TaxID=8236 RepID=UPI001CF6CA1C|nr:interleukin-21 receptor-like [Thunnus albacares]